MTDPISGKLASQMAQQVNQAQQASEAQGAGAKPEAGGASFQEVMQRQSEQAQASERPGAVEMDAAVDPQAGVARGEEAGKLDTFVQGILKDEKELDAMLQGCADGKSMSHDELLQLQGLMYSYSQRVELASKVVEQTTGGLKQIMNTQV